MGCAGQASSFFVRLIFHIIALMPHIFGLADCNNFFASCERVFHPELRDKPVCVLSNNDGVVVARSNEVKRLGIPMAAPYFKVRDTLDRHGVAVFSSNFSLYGDLSSRVMSILRRHAPEIEVYSIDEAFMDFTDVTHPLDSYGRFLRDIIRQWTGIPVSIGFASTKTLAKAANELAKKSAEFAGVCDFSSKRSIDHFLRRVAVEDVWGVGRRIAPVLRSYGIETALDLKRAPLPWIRQRFSIALLRTVQELHDKECFPLGQPPTTQQSMMSSRSFAAPITTFHELRRAVVSRTTSAAARLRRQGCAASYLSVLVGTNFHADEHARSMTGSGVTLPSPTAHTPTLIHYADRVLSRIVQPHTSYRKAGVLLSGIVPEEKLQMNLFSSSRYTERQRRLMGALDDLNSSFGRDTIFFGSAGVERSFAEGKRERRSDRFSTCWHELLRVTT